MNFTIIDKIFKAMEVKADSIGYNLDASRDYLDAVRIVTTIEDEGRKATKSEMMRLTPRSAHLLNRLGFEPLGIEAIELLIA